MDKLYNSTDEYYLFLHDRILKLAPFTGITAAFVFTIARLGGYFEFTEIKSLIGFDITCLLYFVAAYALKRKGIVKDGEPDEQAITMMTLILDALIILQWNLISYIFPTRTFWGYAPMFVMLSAFMFRLQAVLIEITGLTISIAASWIILGDKLLPLKDELFEENLTLRIVALIISFTIIAILTHFAERFTHIAKDNIKELAKKNEELESMGRDIIDFTADIIEERDSTSGSHVKRLKKYTQILAEQVAADYPEYGLTDDMIEEISMASALHDVGKIGISDDILLKPGKLTAEEYEIMKSHTNIGAKIIDKLPDSVGISYKRCCREIALYHHEKYDGGGYPVGLKGDEIPISAQIVSMVDCYDALTNERPYKQAYSSAKAINMILEGECGVFSEKMMSSLIACKDKFTRI